ncbi:MAG: MotA/TolQ/ExbB proton channel family protein [Gammaproteobacteria bacterium]|nr:MotA/TolQ/ExbB proton channel family protein [Gammaproteobacteria bacterium]
MTCPASAFRTFYRWLLFFGLLVYAAYVIIENGLITQLFRDDQSFLSVIILALLLLASLDAGRRAYRLGQELCATSALRERTRSTDRLFVADGSQGVCFADNEPDRSYAHDHLLLLANMTFHNGDLRPQDLLLERLENTLDRGHESGWFLADLMVRLGLLGTVIGFIFMLSSVASIASVDLHALQQLLGQMTGGMRIALYTTLTGLGAGILLGFQYRLLDQGVDLLMSEIIALSEVDVVHHLRHLTRG